MRSNNKIEVCWKTCTFERSAGQGQTCQATSNFCTPSKRVTLYFMGPKKLVFLKHSRGLEGQLKIFKNWDASFMFFNSAMAPGTRSQNPHTWYLSLYERSFSLPALTRSLEQVFPKQDSSSDLSPELSANWILAISSTLPVKRSRSDGGAG